MIPRDYKDLDSTPTAVGNDHRDDSPQRRPPRATGKPAALGLHSIPTASVCGPSTQQGLAPVGARSGRARQAPVCQRSHLITSDRGRTLWN